MFAIEPLRHGLSEVGFVDDVIAVEHRPSLPAGELHDLALGDTLAPKVPGCGAPEIMHEPALEPGFLGGAQDGRHARPLAANGPGAAGGGLDSRRLTEFTDDRRALHPAALALAEPSAAAPAGYLVWAFSICFYHQLARISPRFASIPAD